MRYFWSSFWAFLLMHMATYVVSSMIGTSYDFRTANVLGIAAPILILIIANVIPNEPVEHH